MSREVNYNSIILKKTAFGEADEIITVLSEKTGKIRFLAKSVKLSKSKLQNSLQTFFLADLRVANSRSGKLHKIIGVEPRALYTNLRANISAIKAAYATAEILIRFLPDEQENRGVFNLTKIFFDFLNSENISEAEIDTGLLSFKIKFLELSGFGVKYPHKNEATALFFDNSKGGFVLSQTFSGLPVSPESLKLFLALKEASFKDLNILSKKDIGEIKNQIDSFLEYQLERELKAEKIMRNVV
jgi:DNA repair protein RecO